MADLVSDVCWGMIGAGDVCERKSGPPLYQVPRSRLAAVHRRDRAAGQAFVERHGHGRYYGDLATFLAAPEIDAVYVASPHALHAEHTIAALQAGKHVLVEKPMATKRSDCERMIAAAQAAQRSLAVAYYRRGYPSIARLKTMIESGRLGTLRSASINSEFPTSHRVDLVQFLFGAIQAVEREPDSDGGGYRLEQMAARIVLRTQSGVTVTLSERWTESGMPEALMVEGSAARAYVADLKGGSIVVEQGDTHETLRCGTLRWTHWGLVENVVAHLLDGTALLCDGADGLASTAVLEQIDRAAATADR